MVLTFKLEKISAWNALTPERKFVNIGNNKIMEFSEVTMALIKVDFEKSAGRV